MRATGGAMFFVITLPLIAEFAARHEEHPATRAAPE
jgi:hypothetical protein